MSTLSNLAHVAKNTHHLLETAFLTSADGVFEQVKKGMVDFELGIGNGAGATTGLAYFPIEYAPAAAVINTGESGTLPLPSTTLYDRQGIEPQFYHGQLKISSPAYYFADQYNPGNTRLVVRNWLKDIKNIGATFGDTANQHFNTGSTGNKWQCSSATGDGSTGSPLVVSIKTDADENYRSTVSGAYANERVALVVIATQRLAANSTANKSIGRITMVDRVNETVSIVFDGNESGGSYALDGGVTVSSLHAIISQREGLAEGANPTTREVYGLPDMINTDAYPDGSNEKTLDPATLGDNWQCQVVNAAGTASVTSIDDMVEYMHMSGGMDITSDPFIFLCSPRTIKLLMQEWANDQRFVSAPDVDSRKAGYMFSYSGVKFYMNRIVNRKTIWCWAPNALAMSQGPTGRRGPFWLGRLSMNGGRDTILTNAGSDTAVEYARMGHYYNCTVVNRRRTGIIKNFGT